MKILWVKSDFLHPTNGGGQIRTLETLKRLHQRHEIHFAALDLPQPGAGFGRTSEYCTKAYPVPHPVPRRSGPRYWAELAAGPWSDMPVPMRRYRSSALLRLVETLARLEKFDTIVCDFLASAANVPELGNAVLFQHNVESMIWQRHTEHAPSPWHRAYYRGQYERMLRYEAEVCRAAKRIIAVSGADARAMRSLYGATGVYSVPTGVDTEYFAPPRTAIAPKWDLAFVGAMDWRPNIDGLNWFVAEVLPLIRARRPDCSLAVVGRHPAAEVRKIAQGDRHIHVTGTVDDVRPYLWESAGVHRSVAHRRRHAPEDLRSYGGEDPGCFYVGGRRRPGCSGRREYCNRRFAPGIRRALRSITRGCRRAPADGRNGVGNDRRMLLLGSSFP